MKNIILCLVLLLGACSGPGKTNTNNNVGGDQHTNEILSLEGNTYPGNNEITLSWNKIDGAISYNIYWNNTGNVTILDNIIENVESPYLHSGITNGTPYYYVIAALIEGKDTIYSTEIVGLPSESEIAPPANLVATPGNGRVQLSWSEISGAEYYNIYWSAADSSSVNKSRSSNTDHIQGGLDNGIPYTFQITAVKGETESERSSRIKVIPDLFTSQGVSFISVFGWSTTCAVRIDGSLWCWGENSSGIFGRGHNLLATPEPVRIDNNFDWKAVSVGSTHICGIKTDSTLWCWGNNDKGQLGLGAVSHIDQPVKIGVFENMEMVYSGEEHSCGLKQDGTMWCWGMGTYTPVQIGTSSNWITIEGRCALNSSGELWCWDDFRDSDGIVLIDNTGWRDIDISGGWDKATCLIKQDDGSRWCWGINTDGRLGNGTTSDVPVLSQMGKDTGWVDLSGGADHICGLNEDKTISCWGYDRFRIGAGGNVDHQLYPQPIYGNKQWLQLDTGSVHSCAIRDDHSLWCWGRGDDGQLGTGRTGNDASSNIPVAVTN